MSTQIVRDVAKRFIKSSDPRVLVLKGEWGVGKTYMWKKLIHEFGSESHLTKYSYVSLFGINSLPELRLAIVAKTQTLPRNEKEKKSSLDLGATYNVTKSWLHDRLRDARKVPILNQVTVGFETLAPLLLSETLVCLDDFERMEPDVVTALLGFISELKEERNCKVVIIMNDGKLGAKQAAYSTYREKVVDVELLYAPTTEETVAIVFTDMSRWQELVREHVSKLKISNIRLLKRISDVAALIYDHVKDMHKDVVSQAMHTAVLLVWCGYERDETTPTLVFVRQFSSFGSAFARKNAEQEGKDVDPRITQWEAKLDDYGFRNTDELDLAILEVVEKGYIEGTPLLVEAAKAERMYKARDLDQSFTDAWRLFHDTFANNEDDLIKGLNEAFRRCVETISPLNLNGTVKLLRELKQGTIADELINCYIDHHKNEPERFNLDEYGFGDEITDEMIVEKFNAVHIKDHPLPTLLESAKAVSGTSWSGQHERVLDGATEAELASLFKSDHGRDLARVVRGCVRFGKLAGHTDFGTRVRVVLESFAKESRVNAIRVARYIK